MIVFVPIHSSQLQNNLVLAPIMDNSKEVIKPKLGLLEGYISEKQREGLDNYVKDFKFLEYI